MGEGCRSIAYGVNTLEVITTWAIALYDGQILSVLCDITLPSFLSAELQLFIRSLGTINPTARLFETSKNTLGNELKRSAASAGVKKIRLHDLRHSHASYLIHRGVPILAVSKRLGHETIETTLRTYAHLYPQERDIVLDAIENDPLTNKGSFGGHTQLDKP